MPNTHDRPPRPRRSSRGAIPVFVVAGLAALALLLVWSGPGARGDGSPGQALGGAPLAAGSPAASPAPTPVTGPAPSPAIGGDTRSAGEGPGLVGSPLLAVGGVLALGLAAAALTLLYVRATGGPGPSQ